MNSWQLCGIHPLNVERILERCASWEFFSDEQRAAIVASIPALTAIVVERGEVTDPEIQHAVGPSINFVKWLTEHTGAQPKKGKALENKVQHFRRAMILSHPTLVEERAQRVIDAAVKKDKKAKKKAARDAATLVSATAVVIPAAAVAPVTPAKRKKGTTKLVLPLRPRLQLRYRLPLLQPRPSSLLLCPSPRYHPRRLATPPRPLPLPLPSLLRV